MGEFDDGFEDVAQAEVREQTARLPGRRLTDRLAGDYEADPKPNSHPAMWDLVLEDIKTRDEFGLKKYGTRLQPHNGRDPLIDAYQEALDLVVYLRQAVYEKHGK